MKILLALAALALPACHQGGDENLGLGAHRRDVSVDVGGLTRPGELDKALGLPSAEVARRLGPHRLVATTKLTVQSGDVSDALDESFRLELDGQKGAHLTRETSHGGGSEALLVGGTYYVRPRYGRFVRRSPEGDEVERARDEVQGLLASYLAVLERFAQIDAAGETEVARRRAVGVKLQLAPSPGRFSDPDPAHAWRGTIEVSALDGEVWVDAQSGAPLRERLTANYRSRDPARPVSVSLAFQAEAEGLGAIGPIPPPADSVPSPARPRPLVDRQQLLDGLVPGRASARGGESP